MAMQLKKNSKKEKSTFVATISSSKEDNGAKKSLPPCTKKVPRGNAVVMQEKPPRHLPPRKEEVRKIGSREIGQQLRELLEEIDRVRESMIA